MIGPAFSERLLQTASCLHTQSHFHPILTLCQQHRTLFERFRRKRANLDPDSPEFKNQVEGGEDEPTQQQPRPVTGGLAPTSIFDDSINPSAPRLPTSTPARRLDPLILRAALDPKPKAREQWQRKMLMRDVKNRFRLTKEEQLMRTERVHTARSAFIKTSVKKLGPLARQIAGKPLTEAMVQMRFSKKKAAWDVLNHLKYAKTESVAVKGMGLGKVAEGEKKEGEGQERLVIEDNKGKKRVITNPNSVYIDQAWVGRGPFDFDTDFRARGQGYKLYLPYTSISVVLKEEKTRIRQAEERELKRQTKRVWVPLPDRPVTAQRQYPLW